MSDPLTPEQLVLAARQAVAGHSIDPQHVGASDELARFLDDVVSGRVYAVPLPWPMLSDLTQALLPGTVTVICGDPGVGKTFFVLDCLRFWTNHGHDTAAFFVEKDRKFYLRRLLAQEEGDGRFIDLEWVKQHPEEVAAAMVRQRETLDALGDRMALEGAGSRATLRTLFRWIQRETNNGRRVLVIDPITAADAGNDRWRADDGFMVEVQKLLSRAEASLVLVTHPKKGNALNKSGHDMAAGAAYFRFSDTTLWLTRLKVPRWVTVAGAHGAATIETRNLIQIHKAREAKGTGAELAFGFGDGLHFAEYGVVVQDGTPQEPPAL